MNILFIEDALLPSRGGVERVTYTLANAFERFGHEVFIAYRQCGCAEVPEHKKLQLSEAHEKNSLYLTLSGYIVEHAIRVVIVQNCYDKEYRLVYRQLKTAIPGLRMITCLHCNPDIWVNKNRWGCTFVDIYLKEQLRSVLFSCVCNKWKEQITGMYEIVDKFVLLSPRFIDDFKKLYRVDGKKLYSIANPCTFSDNNAVAFSSKENRVLVVARMAEQQKRISNVLRIWKRICRIHPDWKLVLVGEGPDLHRYKCLAKELELMNCEFAGASSCPQDYYKRAKIFLMTSIWEGFSMTLVEAQHYGCIPMAYDSYSAIKDIIEDGVTGYIIPLHDMDAYAERLSRLMSDDTKVGQMSRNALLASNIKFDIGKIAAQWNELFKSLI